MTGPKGGYYEAELGEPHKFDPTFRGPVHNRGCTDVLCCVIFVIVILGYIVLGTVAWMHGDPRKVVYPTDSYGQFCGQQGTPNANKAILFYFNILQCANPTVLINLQCPTTQVIQTLFANHLSFSLSWNVLYLALACFVTDASLSLLFTPAVCIQVGITSLLDAKEVGVKIFEDYASSWFWILIGLVISMLVSLIFILLLRFTAGVLFWMVIFGVIAAMGYGIWHCYWEYSSLKGKPDSDITISDIGFQTDFRVYLQLRQTWLMFMISLAVIEAIIILVLIFLRNRVRIAIALLKEGSKAIGCIMSTLFYPIITFLLLALCIAYWAVTAVFLASSGDAVYKVMSTLPDCKYTNLTCDPETFSQSNVTKLCPGSQCTFAFYGGESLYHRYIFVLQLCNLLVFLWLVNFTIALGQCTLAGAFASYYWALRKPADIPPCPLASSFGRALRYHTGSLAFGALILSIVQFIRIILEYLDHKLKGAHNAFTRFLLCCLKCCFWCLEHFIKFMNRNAYIMISIYGKNFCASARDAFFLFMRNVMRVAVLDKVTDFLLFLGKLLISGSVGVLAFFFFTRQIPVIQEEVPSLNYYWVPLLTVIFGSYMIAHGFFNVYAMCVDTLFLCFLLDLEKNDGSATRPYYMGSSLRAILNKKNKRPEEKKKRRKHKKEQPNKRH
uniref:Choline transporter-like protein n=1 Tax=Sinocyclocheilus anshuiensis TaxID=1608454 RepID=A0A671Q0B6_9TELE